MSDELGLGEPGVARAIESLKSILIPSETLEAWAIQRRMYALANRRILLAATSGRLICLRRGLFGGFTITDLRWQDLEEVQLRVGVVAADLTIRVSNAVDLASAVGTAGGRHLEFKGLRKGPAQAVYRICQAQDQAWREKRRVRDLEELRARSGGIQVTSGSSFTGAGPADSADSVRRLTEAKQLVEAKLITDSEYEAIKAKILSGSA